MTMISHHYNDKCRHYDDTNHHYGDKSHELLISCLRKHLHIKERVL